MRWHRKKHRHGDYSPTIFEIEAGHPHAPAVKSRTCCGNGGNAGGAGGKISTPQLQRQHQVGNLAAF